MGAGFQSPAEHMSALQKIAESFGVSKVDNE
jgi:hypothetical protein